MDNVTHTLVGLMLSRAVFPRPVARAPLMMMISANLPDIDVVSLFGGSLAYIQYHRGGTHALAAAPFLALLPVLLVREKRAVAYVGSLAAVLSHLVLDWTNVYGIRLLLPFSSRWLHLDITNVVDLWIAAILLLSFFAPLIAGMVTSEIGGQRSSGVKRGWALFALLALFSYEGARFVAHSRALALMSARLYNGAPPRIVAAVPSAANLLSWRGIVEAPGFVANMPVNLQSNFDPSQAHIDYDATPDPAIDAARHTRPFEIFGKFNQLPLWRVTPVSDGVRVELMDLRFGTPELPGFEAVATIDSSGRVLRSRFGF